MAKSEEGPNQDSIKPVSSLRSLFESKAAQEPGSITPFTIPTARAIARHESTQTVTRASLDIPRPVSPWSSSEDTSATHLSVTPGPPIARPSRPNPRVLQRPLSTTALTEPRSPPLMTVESPQSPPKATGNASTQYLLRSPLARPLTPVSVETTSPQAAPVPPRRLPRVPTTYSQLLVANDMGIAQELGPIHTAPDDIPIQKTAKSFPPPVNRADKPKIPTKPVAVSHGVKLEPLPTPAERVSPFSTPPSSDESVSHGSPQPTPLNRGTTPPVKVNAATEIHSHSPSRSWSAQRRVPGSNTIPPAKMQRPDARRFGFNAVSASHEAGLEDRPDLPPRGPREQRIAAVHDPNDRKDTFHRATQRPTKSVSPRNTAKELHSAMNKSSEFLPPPKRAPLSMISGTSDHHRQNVVSVTKPTGDLDVSSGTGNLITHEIESSKPSSVALEYPDASITNRRPPQCKRGIHEIDIGYDCRHVDICGNYVATAGHLTRAWDLRSGNMVLSLGHLEKEIRVTSMAFKPGAKATEEGLRLWIGTNYGDLQEVDILTNNIVHTKTGAHERREIVKIYRHQASMWTLDDSGKLCVWSGSDTGVPDLQRNPSVQRVPKGHTFSIKIQDNLWLATGKEIRIFRPSTIEATTSLVQEPLSQTGVGAVTSGAVISGQFDRVYFGHADGKITIYSTVDFTCLSIVHVSIYKISSLAGAGFHLWAGYNTGMVYVYDTRTQPWTTKKEWLAHSSPVLGIVTDRSSLWKDGMLRVASLGADNALKMWDGTLEDDWIDDDMQDHDIEYSSFREITALVVTWNAGAATPTHLRYEESEPQFFQTILQSVAPPDLLVFGFQELVDLEDKKLTAKNLFKGNKKKDPSEQEHMSRQYRAWRDYLVRCIEDVMPSNEPYHLLHTASMVGLFSCVFIKGSQHSQVRDVSAAELKRGMGGLHGNKGALVMRFILDDSSLCLVNCHLAAGQTQTVNRNNDLTAILETALLPPDRGSSSHSAYIGGGDGSMVLDNEICILNGDLNYRIDTMGRDTVVKAVKSSNLSKLLERDQLLVSRRRNPLFRARAFKECPITFAPTYKYDVGSNNYDTSEKRRAPAWCDRILYRGPGNIKQIDYCRHELWLSDHRPVSGVFKIRVKKITEDKRAKAWQESKQRFGQARERLASDAKIEYLRDVLGVPLNEAKRLL